MDGLHSKGWRFWRERDEHGRPDHGRQLQDVTSDPPRYMRQARWFGPSLSPLALVSALRETSVLLAGMLGWLAFGERLTRYARD